MDDFIYKKKWFDESVPTNPKSASATLTFSDVVVAAETVTIDDVVYEFVAVAGDIADPANIPVVVGTTLTADNAVTKLASAVNATSTVVTATANTTDDTCVITYNTVGTAGNSVDVATTCTNASFGESVTTLSGGQFGTPCIEKNTMVFATPYYYVCTKQGGIGNVEWKRFTPATY